MNTQMTSWLRKDGRKGIRNVVLVVYLVEGAHHVCKKIAHNFPDTNVQVIGFSGCFPGGYGSFSQDITTGGLSTIGEKSLGTYAKSGNSQITGILHPEKSTRSGGLYLLDVVPDGPPKFGFPNINDNAEIIELISCGAHAVIFVTGRGSVVRSAISPVLKVCANPDTYARMHDDMDVNAGGILTGDAGLDGVGDEICEKLRSVGAGQMTASEETGLTEFAPTYKTKSQDNPGCHAAT